MTDLPTSHATIHVNPRRDIGRVDPNIFGSFIENLHRCIYGGVYDPTSPVADSDGFRTDVIDAARAMGVTNVRFPAGASPRPITGKTGSVRQRTAR